MDEPFSSLDITLRDRLSLEVRDILKSYGISAVMVTHNQHEAFAMADVIGVMHDGKLVQWDTAYVVLKIAATIPLFQLIKYQFISCNSGRGMFFVLEILTENSAKAIGENTYFCIGKSTYGRILEALVGGIVQVLTVVYPLRMAYFTRSAIFFRFSFFIMLAR